jgi:hypothetical protein
MGTGKKSLGYLGDNNWGMDIGVVGQGLFAVRLFLTVGIILKR